MTGTHVAGRPILVVGQKHGRLGNRLALAAQLMALAAEHGCVLLNPALDELADELEGPAGDLLCSFPTGILPRVPATPKLRHVAYRAFRRSMTTLTPFQRAIPGLDVVLEPGRTLATAVDLDDEGFSRRVRASRLVVIEGFYFWYTSRADAFRRHAPAIRRFLSPRAAVLDAARRRAAQFREEQGLQRLVAVHIRQGDYRTYEGGRFYFPTSHYAAVMRQVASLVAPERVGFVVCSDTRQSAADFAGLPVLFGAPGSAVDDVALMARCDLLVSAPSSFASWASFLGEVPHLRVTSVDLAQVRLEAFAVDSVPDR